ncbi:hypothetical protein BDD12DRAFT_983569, partial [Trichophaea hybrida]
PKFDAGTGTSISLIKSTLSLIVLPLFPATSPLNIIAISRHSRSYIPNTIAAIAQPWRATLLHHRPPPPPKNRYRLKSLQCKLRTPKNRRNKSLQQHPLHSLFVLRCATVTITSYYGSFRHHITSTHSSHAFSSQYSTIYPTATHPSPSNRCKNLYRRRHLLRSGTGGVRDNKHRQGHDRCDCVAAVRFKRRPESELKSILREENTRETFGEKHGVEVTVVDRCTGCKPQDLDFSPGAFKGIAEEWEGR